MNIQTTHLTALALDAARLAGALSELTVRRPEVPASRLAQVGAYHGGAGNFEAVEAS